MAYLESSPYLFKRTVLSAPAKVQEIKMLNQIILAVSVLSILGAGWIVLSFCVSEDPCLSGIYCMPPSTDSLPQLFKQVRTFRHQLILGLAISDFWMAVNFLSSCAMNLSGNILSEPPQKKFCSFNGFMTQLFVVQSKLSRRDSSV